MSVVTYFGVSIPSDHANEPPPELVFENRIEALKVCKKFKGSRFKCFTDKDEAIQFTLTKQSIDETSVAIKELPSERLPFPTPSPQDMLAFRKIIEAGDCRQFLEYVWRNPR